MAYPPTTAPPLRHDDDDDDVRSPVAAAHYEVETPRDDSQSMVSVLVDAPPPALPAPTHSLSYRPDIDGLRALAVIPVVVFHAYPTSIPGGFTGVDIFLSFPGKFTYANFYSRRIRRIFPGLILVLTFTIVAGCLWYLEEALVSMAKTLAAGTVFGANIQVLLLKQTYFSSSVKEDPLLHLWSLGVEEQFYIFWPFVVALLAKLPAKAAVAGQVVILVASFALNIAMLGHDGNNNWSFYFPFCRFWQMAMGGLLAYMSLDPSVPRLASVSTVGATAVGAVGLALIVVGFVCIDESMAFPGYWSLLPTVGAALLILSGPDTPLHRWTLSLRPVIFVGHISYALYLWHWPLLVYAKARFPNDALRPWFQSPYMMMVYSVAASVCTLYGVENLLRRRKHKLVVPCLSLCMAILFVLGLVMTHFPTTFSVLSQPKPISSGPILTPVATHINGTAAEVPNMSKPPMYESPTVAKILAAKGDFQPDGPEFHTVDAGSPYIPTSENMILNMGQKDNLVIVFGDSHGHMLKPRFSYLYRQAVNKSAPFPTIVFKTRNGTPPLGCTPGHADVVAMIKQVKPKAVFYATDWPQWIRPNAGAADHGTSPQCCTPGYVDACNNQSPKDAKQLLATFQSELAAFTALGIKVFVATLNPEGPAFNFANMLNGNSVGAVAPVSKSAYKAAHAELIAMVEGAVKAVNGTIIDYTDNQCWKDDCNVVSNVGEPLMRDNDHFRPAYVASYLSVVDQVAIAGLSNATSVKTW
ncbi:hypothetical protein SPRG_15894 [Saprolegnia parasitica CBS 223.65]|uniref:Acyltransferase 3 domain-containing protein n=1 Tax=Saprolegnia parasitica (strain CBS 223.65) TaxID=695850 RepID=A0A067BKU8_SAPPC|nr:hypothetical protein SPRG_15894 [Saprolegnia parasitica CBS 223.65]KDO18808.1 hypothetical protein SPRG_15894 [Saprolegnia parasitica CBS 223.65]|eukprot:XP_012210491.1 hypothetical protein SPRG_15894 [Saprolegnia parasitica CBS 223.65]